MLAAVAIPLYGNYVTRSEVSASLAAAKSVQTAIDAKIQEGGATSLTLAGTSASDISLTALPAGITFTTAGVISIAMATLNSDYTSGTLQLTPTLARVGVNCSVPEV